MKRALPVAAVLLLLGLLLFKAPKVALVMSGVAVAALLVAHFAGREPRPPEEVPDAPPPPLLAPEPDPRVAAAFNVGRRELSQPESPETNDIELPHPEGTLRVRVGYHGDSPFVALRTTMGEETEMAFVIRRHHSSIGLPPIVDNTPIETAAIEYRLRSIPLQTDLGRLFDAASNRPRLFRQLLDRGLESDVGDLVYHSRYRLEDIVYSGTTLTLVVQPAEDPSRAAYVQDCLDFTRPIVVRLRSFLTEATIPSAQS